MHALTIKDLYKTYPNNVAAVKGISLKVGMGQFYGLLGPNGAGKSTTIGIISSIVNKTSGTIEVCGYDLDTNATLAKTCMGLVPQEMNFNIFEKVIDIVANQGGYYGLSRKLSLQRAEKYLKLLGLWDKRNHVSKSLSGGMKRRLMIARALVHEPKVLVLDEPTAGVDIELRRSTWEFLREINQQGITIILTTHYLEEAEYLCNRLAIIDQGVILEETDVKTLLGQLKTETFILDLQNPTNQENVDKLKGINVSLLDSTTLEVTSEKTTTLHEVFHQLSKQGIEVVSMRNKSNRLEELFLGLIQANKVAS